jgi:hypothetical protein
MMAAPTKRGESNGDALRPNTNKRKEAACKRTADDCASRKKNPSERPYVVALKKRFL